MRQSSGSKSPRRANGEGSLRYDKARDRWRGAIAWTDPDGAPKRKAWSDRSRATVVRKMAAARRDLADGHGPVSTDTLRDYLTRWLDAERARVRPSTWLYREGHIRLYVIPKLGGVKLGALTPSQVELLTTGLVERGHAPRTAVGVRVTLRKALSDALRDGLVSRNVAALARPPRAPAREVEYLTRDELRRVLDACEGDPWGPLVILAGTTGLRLGELQGLAWADVDMAARTLTVRRALARSWDGWALAEPKTPRSRRTIHLPDKSVAALRERAVAQDAERDAAGPDVWQDRDGLIFTDRIGRATKPWDVNGAWHVILERAGVRSVPFHCLRHTWATLALSQGVPLKVIADNLGHASITVTAQFYSGIVPELGRDAADAIGRALA